MESRFKMQDRNLAELSAHWPMAHSDLLDWFNGPAVSLSDHEYGLILAKLKQNGLTQKEVRSLLDIPFSEPACVNKPEIDSELTGETA